MVNGLSRFLMVLVAGIILVPVLPWLNPMVAEGQNGSFGGGNGTLANPYIIEDVWDLQNMNSDLNAHYVLGNDIDASATRGWNSGAGFEPVGKRYVNFNGSLDGRNHTITGLYIERSDAKYVGLFGYLGPGSLVTNVGLIDANVTGLSGVGVLAGLNNGTVSNCYSGGYVTGSENDVGGLVGRNYYALLTTSHSSAYVTARSPAHKYLSVGGLVGYNCGGVVRDCYATGRIVGGPYCTGGLIGLGGGHIVSRSYSTGDVSGRGDYVGGLIGKSSGMEVIDSHASGNVTGVRLVGGLIGSNSNSEVTGCYASGRVSGEESVGGLIGSDWGGTISDSYSTGDTDGDRFVGGLMGGPLNYTKLANSHYPADHVLINGNHHLTVGGLFNAQYDDWFSSGLALDISAYSTTLVPSGHGYDVVGVQGLRDLLGFSDIEGISFRLASDVDLASVPGLYVPYLRGVLDGDGHKVSNMRLDMPFAGYLGIVGLVSNGEVRGVHVVDCYIAGVDDVGSVAGSLEYGTVSGSLASGRVTGRENVGGLLGYVSYSSTVNGSRADAEVNGSRFIGGFLGINYGWVADACSSGTVVGNESIGGLIGVNQGMVLRSYSNSSVHGKWSVGGLVGFNEYGVISSSYASGDVTVGTDRAGGFVGSNLGNVNDSYARGNVTISTVGSTISFGGFVGEHGQGEVLNCYSTGEVVYEGATRPTDKGFAGHVPISGEDGMAGDFWDEQTSGQSNTSGNATGVSTVLMKTRATFVDVGWDFTSIWCIIEGTSYPFLRWQDKAAPTADAGPDQVVEGGTLITFDGSRSRDDIGIADYTWTFEDQTTIVLHGERLSYLFARTGVFPVTLTVTDAVGNYDKDNMTVTVNDTTPPVADAGPDQTVNEDEPFILDAGGSSDNVGIVNWTWKRFKPVWLDDPYWYYYNQTITLWITSPGTHTIYLTVRDAAGNEGHDEVNVTVIDVLPPRANAGSDQTVDEGTMVKFYGGNSYDSGRIENYTWSFNYGMEEVAIYGKEAYFTFDVPGTYVVTLKVTDFAGHSSTDTLNVTVVDITPPLVDAGPDQTVDEGSTVAFDGGGSVDDGGIANYTWSFDLVSGPIVLYGVSPAYKFDTPGIYVITLNVTDAAGHWGTDTMTLTVADRTPPVADAGPDRIVPIGTTVELNGSLSVDNGVLAFVWNFTYNGEPRSLTGETAQFRYNRAGVYEVVLTVTDASGNRDDDTVVVTVVDTGRVIGIVLDEGGRPVKGALVTIVASDNSTHSMMTAVNGSFAEDVHYGPFTWKVTKSGYRGISGSSSVDAMGMTELDLSRDPLVKKDDGQSMTADTWSVVVVVLCVVVIVVLVALRRLRSRSHPR